jgi:hypothetical protein
MLRAELEAARAALRSRNPRALHEAFTALQPALDKLDATLLARRTWIRAADAGTAAGADAGAAGGAGAVAGSGAGGARLAADPRFAFAELMSAFLLRAPQVDLVRDFVAAAREGRSLVQQLLMGAGKTQVIAPLLVLLLGDGRTATTLVTPVQLLAQIELPLAALVCNAVIDRPLLRLRIDRTLGKNEPVSAAPAASALAHGFGVAVPACLRARAGAAALVVAETLQVVEGLSSEARARALKEDASWPPPHAANAAGTLQCVALLRHLRRVRARGGAVLAAPEHIKSLLLAFVDMLHAEDEVFAAAGGGAGGGAGGAPVTARSARAQRRSASARAVGELLDFFRGAGEDAWRAAWQEVLARDPAAAAAAAGPAGAARSVAVIDESDSVFHPLRSELNYPLGEKQELPLGDLRFGLPAFLCEALLSATAAALEMIEHLDLGEAGAGSAHERLIGSVGGTGLALPLSHAASRLRDQSTELRPPRCWLTTWLRC